MKTPKSEIKKKREIGELDIGSFLSTLGKDNDDDNSSSSIDLNETTTSFKTAIEPPTTVKKKPLNKQQSTIKSSSSKKQQQKLFEEQDDDVDIDEEEQSIKKKLKMEVKNTPKKNEMTKMNKKKQPEKESSTKKDVEEEEDDDDDDDEEILHRQELQKLEKSDPEFYAHLLKEGKDLLKFGDDDDDEEEEAEQEFDDGGILEEEEEEQDVEEDDSHKEQQQNLSLESIKKLENRVLKGDATSIRRLIRAFRNATAKSKVDDEEDVKFETPIESYDRLITVSLSVIAKGLELVLWNGKQQQQSKRKMNVLSSPHFKTHSHKIKQLILSLTRCLNSKDVSPDIVQRLLLNCRLFVPYYAAFPVEGKKFLKLLIQIWSRPVVDGALRIASFFRIKQLCDTNQNQFLEDALRDSYAAFARSATSSNKAFMERGGIQARCLVELYQLNPSVSYRIAFQHIRQLALHVRSAMASKTQESLQSISSWQFLHCLRLWGFILSATRLHDLEFPLIQVALGVLGLVSTSRYIPLRIHCVEIINRLCQESETFAPVSIHLVQILKTNDLIHKQVIASTDAAPELSGLIKFKTDQIHKGPTKAVVVLKTIEQIKAHLKIHRNSVAFPEIWGPLKISLLKTGLIKEGKKRTDAWRASASKALNDLFREVDKWSQLVQDAREGRIQSVKRPAGPCDIEGCQKFSISMKSFYQNEKEEEKLDFFPVAKAVDNILLQVSEENQKEKSNSNGNHQSSHDDDDDEQEESVKKLNPSDFL